MSFFLLPNRHTFPARRSSDLPHGAVSEIVARAMAFGAVRHSHARVSVAVTGIAGPTGGSPDKPVGTVWFAFMVDGRLASETRRFDGDRRAVRRQTVDHAIARLVERIEEWQP